jgi:hypothetical protein
MARKKPAPPLPHVDLGNFAEILDGYLNLALTDPAKVPGMLPSEGNPVSLAPRMASAEAIAAKTIARAVAAAPEWLAGVKNPRKEPLKEALAKATKWLNAMQEVIRTGKWQAGIKATDEAAMYATIDALGSGVYSSGISARTAKIGGSWGKLQPLQVALCAALDAMPTDTKDQRTAKLLAAREGMLAIGAKLRGLK